MNLEKQKTAAGYEVIEIGNYNMSDITWRVLDEDDEKMLVISEKVLDFAPMGFSFGSKASWKISDLRQINEDFLENEYFEVEEQKYIIKNKNNDILFLLTKKELEKYLPNPNDRTAKELVNIFGNGCYKDFFETIDYSDGEIAYEQNNNQFLPYWTGSMYNDNGDMRYAYVVKTDGTFGGESWGQICGIRPAMWVKKIK